MDLTEFQELEDKITQTLEKIDHLKKDNAELRQKLKQMESELFQKSEVLNRTEEELANTKQRNEEKEEKVRQKVITLLDRLNNL